MLVPGGQRRAVLEPLLSDTQYKVTVTPVYRDGRDGVGVSALGSTCKPHKARTRTNTRSSESLTAEVSARFLRCHDTKMLLNGTKRDKTES